MPSSTWTALPTTFASGANTRAQYPADLNLVESTTGEDTQSQAPYQNGKMAETFETASTTASTTLQIALAPKKATDSKSLPPVDPAQYSTAVVVFTSVISAATDPAAPSTPQAQQTAAPVQPTSTGIQGGLSTSTKVGLGLGVPLGALITILLLACFLCRRRKCQHGRRWDSIKSSIGYPADLQGREIGFEHDNYPYVGATISFPPPSHKNGDSGRETRISKGGNEKRWENLHCWRSKIPSFEPRELEWPHENWLCELPGRISANRSVRTKRSKSSKSEGKSSKRASSSIMIFWDKL